MITLEIHGADVFQRKIAQLPEKINQALINALQEMGSDSATSIIQAADFDDFTGDIRSKTRYVSEKDGRSGNIIMPEHGIFVDRATPHFVSVRQDRPQLITWGLQARSTVIRGRAAAVASGKNAQFSLYVRPHPFIDKGFNRSAVKHQEILQKHLERAFN